SLKSEACYFLERFLLDIFTNELIRNLIDSPVPSFLPSSQFSYHQETIQLYEPNIKGTSFMNSENNRGSSINPYGTPVVIRRSSESLPLSLRSKSARGKISFYP